MGTILVADDDPVVRHLLSSALTAAGYTVETVESGAKCIALVQERVSKDMLPDLLLLDLQLMDMPGTEVLRKVREMCAERKLPVVMLSASSREEVLQSHPYAAEADNFLTKPFPMDQVLAVIRSTLR